MAALALAGCSGDRLNAVEAELVAQPLDFGSVEIGTQGHGALLLTNLSGAPIHLRGVKAIAPFSSATFAAPVVIPAGQSRAVALAFTPDAPGAQQQLAAIESDADRAVPVKLRGFGAKIAVALNPGALDFGAVPLHATRSLSVALTNSGNAPAVISQSPIDGLDASLFSTSDAVSVPAGGQAVLTVSVKAQHLGPMQAVLHLKACQSCAEQTVALAAHGIASALDVEPDVVDFGTVAVGDTAMHTVEMTNAGDNAVTVNQAFVTASSDGDFSAPASQFVLQPGEHRSVTVQFVPDQEGARHGTLRVVSDDPNAPRIDVALQGGGDQLATLVDPRSLDFGTVAVGMTTQQVVSVYNVSSSLDLTLRSAAVVQGARFAGGAAGPITIAAGEHRDIPVVYAPTAVGHDSGTLQIVTDENGGTTVNVALTGAAVQLAPCQWAARPAQLDFGMGAPGEIRTLAVDLTNVGAGDCAFSDIALSPASDGAFAQPDGPEASALLHPGDWTTVRVSFAPYAEGNFTGSLQFFVSNPSQPVGQVPIFGSAAHGCLTLSPAQLDFGSVAGMCGAAQKTITATNTCSAPVDIASVALGQGDTNEFTLAAGNTSAHSLAGGASETVAVQYQPTDDSLDLQSVVWTLADGGVHLVGLQGVGVMDPTETDHFTQKDRAKVDQLFVVDNSGSMSDKQDALAANFHTFLQQAVGENIDFHIAVTTTGLTEASGGWVQCPGGAEGGEAGRFFPVDNSSPRILTPATPNLEQAFSTAVHVGTCHWLEEGLEAARLALSQPLSGEVDDPDTQQPNDGNAGFLRSDARLSVIVVSDADDQSPDTVENYESFFRSLKGNQPGQFVFSGILTPDNKSVTCPNGESSGDRYMQLANATGGVTENVCTSDWGATVAQLALAAFGPTTHFPLSVKPADTTQIQVEVNGQVVTSGWSYDAATNSVVFDQASAPPSGSSIDITYPVGC